MDIRAATRADVTALVALWERCGLLRPWNDPRADIERALGFAGSTVLVGMAGDALAASVMVGEDGHRGWIYYLAVEPEERNAGHGRAMLLAAEGWLRERGVPKLNLMVRTENEAVEAFYASLGYERSQVIVLAKPLAR